MSKYPLSIKTYYFNDPPFYRGHIVPDSAKPVLKADTIPTVKTQ